MQRLILAWKRWRLDMLQADLDHADKAYATWRGETLSRIDQLQLNLLQSSIDREGLQ